jgi:hypothetical protein
MSVHHPEFIKLSYQFSVISCQLKTITDQRSTLGAHHRLITRAAARIGGHVWTAHNALPGNA